MATEPARLELLSALARKVLWLSSWTIHHANHIRENTDGLKVGGHQASSASLATIMSALYFGVLRPEDRVAVKPHASPVFHAIQYLFGRQTRDRLENFRGFRGAQSYPSRTKDTDDVDFSTGSVGLGVAQTLFASLVQDYVRAHGWGRRPEGRMIALVGDAELDEGNVFEALLEGWKQGLRNCWWIIDYNRQSLEAVDHDRPVCFSCYTIKGVGLPFAGHKDNHAGLMTPAQMEKFRAAMAVRPGREWDKFEGLALPPQTIEAFLKRVPFAAGGPRRLKAPPLAVPEELPVAIQPVMATETGFGAILNELGRQRVPFTERIVTASPDVTVSTNLGPWVNRRSLFAREAMADTF